MSKDELIIFIRKKELELERREAKLVNQELNVKKEWKTIDYVERDRRAKTKSHNELIDDVNNELHEMAKYKSKVLCYKTRLKNLNKKMVEQTKKHLAKLEQEFSE